MIKRLTKWCVFLCICALAMMPTQSRADSWTGPVAVGIEGVHMASLHTDRIFVFSFRDQGTGASQFPWATFDPTNLNSPSAYTAPSAPRNYFCAGHSVLANGNVVLVDGQADGTVGLLSIPENGGTESLNEVGPIASGEGRWYPSTIILGNGHLFSLGGVGGTNGDGDGTNDSGELFNPDTNARTPLNGDASMMATQDNDAYPRLFLLSTQNANPNIFRVFEAGPNAAQFYTIDTGTNTGTLDPTSPPSDPGSNAGGGTGRLQATYCRLFDGRVMAMGGFTLGAADGTNPVVTAIDPEASSPSWQTLPNMIAPNQSGGYQRSYFLSTLLPNEEVVVYGSGTQVEIYNPTSVAWRLGEFMSLNRGYHSTGVLMRDGRVCVSGGANGGAGGYGETNEVQVYSPDYVTNDQLAGSARIARPTINITGTTLPAAARGTTISVPYISAEGPITQVHLHRPGSSTHSFTYNMKAIPCSFTDNGSTLQVTLPSNPNMAPPGYYYLFISCGPVGSRIPSVGKWIHVSGNAPAPCTVPGVVGQTQASAESAITGAGFSSSSSTASSSTIPSGNVISQTPSGGASATCGSNVSIVVSTGAALCSVPGVVGQTQASAESAITSAGLAAVISTASSSTVPSGNVISQTPSGGASVTCGSNVSVIVSAGSSSCNIPNVVGLLEQAAIDQFALAGFTSSVLITSQADAAPMGTVLSQSPASGAVPCNSSNLSLVVSTGSGGGGGCGSGQPYSDYVGAGQASGVVVTTSSNDGAANGTQTVNGSGLSGTTHSTAWEATWTTNGDAGNPAVANPSFLRGPGNWIQYDLGHLYTLGTMHVWNGNEFPTRGLNSVHIDYSTDGTIWTNLTSKNFAIAAGGAAYAGTQEADFGGVCVRYVVITVNSNHGDAFANQLSEVRFNIVAGGGGGPSLCSVPGVVGQTQASAESAITGAGFASSSSTASSSTVPSGNVISQTPSSGASVACGSSVSVVVSTGPASCSVPGIVGQTQASAESAITSAGFTSSSSTASSSTVPTGSVISQTPSGGASVACGSNVSIVVSTGPAGGGGTGPITITNFSFELPGSGSEVSNWANIPGWSLSPSTDSGLSSNDGGTNGTWTAYIGNAAGFVTQTTSHTIAAGTYQVQIDAQESGTLQVQLFNGSTGTTLTGGNGAFAVSGGFSTYTLNVTVAAGNSAIGQALGVRFQNSASGGETWTVVDNVRVTKTN